MWQVSVDSVDKCLDEAPLKKGTNSAQLHKRLFTTLKTVRNFYHCGGDGLCDEDLDSDLYKVWVRGRSRGEGNTAPPSPPPPS